MAIKLPDGAEPLDPVEFSQRYPHVFTDMALHVAATLGTNEDTEQAKLRVFNACTPGALQVAQFAAVNGEPAVFGLPDRQLNDEGRQFVEAIVSYFDTRGSFHAESGEVGPSEAIARIGRYALAFAEDPRAAGTTEGQRLALGYFADTLGIDPTALMDRFVAWRAQHPDADAGQFFDTEVPEERRAEVSAGYQQFRQTLLKYGSFSPEIVTAYVEKFQQHTRDRIHQAHLKKEQADAMLASLQGSPSSEVIADAVKYLDGAKALRAELGSVGLIGEAPLDLHRALARLGVAQNLSVEELLNRWVEARKTAPTLIPEQWLERLQVQYATPQPGDPVYKIPEASLEEWLTEEYPDAIERLSRAATVSKRIVRETLDRWVNTGVLRFIRVPADPKDRPSGTYVTGVLPKGWPEFTNRTERAIRDEMSHAFKLNPLEDYIHGAKARGLRVTPDSTGYTVEHAVGPDGKVLSTVRRGERGDRPGEHTYMRAIEAQYQTLTSLLHGLSLVRATGQTTIGGVRFDEILQRDANLLKRADTFCWFEEPILAVERAAESLPDTVRLTRDLTEHDTCWWYFTLPQDIPTTGIDEACQALLWGWEGTRLQFGTYVNDLREERRLAAHQPGLSPTAHFSWMEGETLAHALARVRRSYQSRTPEFLAAMGPEANMTEEETVRTVERLLRFFVAGCLWVQQRILVYSKGQVAGRVERHERKRMERELQRPLTDVQIIQLRRRESVSAEKSGEPNHVSWSCRWIVKGHWRNQYYPSKASYQPKWIDSYPKGPDDKPLKVPQHRVYAVSR